MYVAGFVSGDIARTPDGGLPGQTSLGSVDAFVRKYDATGAEQWTRQFGTTGADYAYAVAVDATGNIFVGGFTSGIFPGQTSAGGMDLFVRKYDATGVEQWTRQFGWPGDDHGYSLSVDSAGNVYFVGDFAASPATQSEPEPIASFLRKYDPGGPETWTKLLSARTDIYAQSVAVGSDDAVYVAA